MQMTIKMFYHVWYFPDIQTNRPFQTHCAKMKVSEKHCSVSYSISVLFGLLTHLSLLWFDCKVTAELTAAWLPRWPCQGRVCAPLFVPVPQRIKHLSCAQFTASKIDLQILSLTSVVSMSEVLDILLDARSIIFLLCIVF